MYTIYDYENCKSRHQDYIREGNHQRKINTVMSNQPSSEGRIWTKVSNIWITVVSRQQRLPTPQNPTPQN